MANLESLILRDTRANQPAAGIAGRLYYVTDEEVMERDNGVAWQSVEGVGGGAGTDTTALHDNVSAEISALTEKITLHDDDLFVIEDSAASNVKKKVKKSNVGGSSASIWTQVINESGASFANFTGVSGTWSSDGTVIKQTDTSANRKRAFYTTQVSTAGGILEAEIQIISSGAVRRGGLTFGWDGSSGSSMLISALDQNGTLVIESDQSAALTTVSATVNINTWYKMRMVLYGNRASVYLDGVLKASVQGSSLANIPFIGFYNYQAETWFRNIKFWNLVMPA